MKGISGLATDKENADIQKALDAINDGTFKSRMEADIAKAKEEKGADWKDMEESDREAYTTRFGKDEIDRLYAGQTLAQDSDGDYTNNITASAIQYKGTDLTLANLFANAIDAFVPKPKALTGVAAIPGEKPTR